MNLFNDAILKQMYLGYDIPCDSFVSNFSLIQDFTRDYTNRTGQIVKPARLAHHTLNLRRRGQAKGGLSRLRRAYNGWN
jgi:hypothetical protein